MSQLSLHSASLHTFSGTRMRSQFESQINRLHVRYHLPGLKSRPSISASNETCQAQSPRVAAQISSIDRRVGCMRRTWPGGVKISKYSPRSGLHALYAIRVLVALTFPNLRSAHCPSPRRRRRLQARPYSFPSCGSPWDFRQLRYSHFFSLIPVMSPSPPSLFRTSCYPKLLLLYFSIND